MILKVSKEVDRIYLSFNLESIAGILGVTTSCSAGGLSTEEAIEICYLAGLHSSKIVAFDACEFNPFVED